MTLTEDKYALKEISKRDNFVQIKEYHINLNNVMSIKIEDKIIVNMAYTTQTKAGYKPDFIFIEDYSEDDVNRLLNNPVFSEKFIKVYNGNGYAYINIDSIGSFKYEPDKKRYIINFKCVHTYSFEPEKKRVLAEFMYAYEEGV